MPKSAASQPLFLYSTTVSDVGTVRANNQDSSFAGEHLIAMCDGMAVTPAAIRHPPSPSGRWPTSSRMTPVATSRRSPA